MIVNKSPEIECLNIISLLWTDFKILNYQFQVKVENFNDVPDKVVFSCDSKDKAFLLYGNVCFFINTSKGCTGLRDVSKVFHLYQAVIFRN